MRFTFHARMSLLFVALAITLASACADYENPDEPDDVGQSGDPAQDGDEPSPDTGTPGSQATRDAGGFDALDASVSSEDASTIGGGSDGGRVVPTLDAGRPGPTSDAGSGRADAGRDAGAKADASADVGACGTLTYASFGTQFMATYCASCHSGSSAQHSVQLDTLAGVQKNKAAVKRQTVTGTNMPSLDPRPSAAERQKLGQWLDCGAN